MPSPRQRFPGPGLRWPLIAILAFLPLFSACKQAPPPAAEPIDDSGGWAATVPDLKALDVSNAEIAELTTARSAGLSDPGSVELVKIARSRHKPFADGQAVADLLSVKCAEPTVIELSRLNQLALWGGQARILRLAGHSDKVILAVAHRRAEGLPVLSENKLDELRDAGASEATILDFITKGVGEKQASDWIAERQREAGGHGFVYQRRSRRRS